MLGTILQFDPRPFILKGNILVPFLLYRLWIPTDASVIHQLQLNRRTHRQPNALQSLATPTIRTFNEPHSPVGGLPNEILLKIFSELVEEIFHLSVEEKVDPVTDLCTGVSTLGLQNHINKNGKAALVITQVCARWRRLAMGRKAYWSVVDLDTIQPVWFLEMLHRSGEAALSFFSQVPHSRHDSVGIHIWSLVHSQFHRCKRLHVHVTVDPRDARAVGGLLATEAPRLEDCAIHYIPHPSRRFAETVGDEFEAGNARLFNNVAPLLRSIQLVDCHFPPSQDLFPNLRQFYTSICGPNEQTDYSQRRGLPDFMVTMSPFSRIETLSLLEAIDHTFHPRHELIPRIDHIHLPHLQELQFVGSAYAASHLLRVIQTPIHCSFFLNVDGRCWDAHPPSEFASSMVDLIRPISSENSPHSWLIGLNAAGVFSLRVDGLSLVYDLTLSTTEWEYPLDTLTEEDLWAVHPCRLEETPSRMPADIAYSCSMKALSSHFQTSLEAAHMIEVDIQASEFSFRQTTHVLERMLNVTQIAVRNCRADLIQAWEAVLPPNTSKDVVLRCFFSSKCGGSERGAGLTGGHLDTLALSAVPK
ncbi:hypothetical protein NMY22_g15812 [Coprinellus aureogranulatus]|nr:hypothetical protein NMY22_g15812 [Coprinellus aureogranulatus]